MRSERRLPAARRYRIGRRLTVVSVLALALMVGLPQAGLPEHPGRDGWPLSWLWNGLRAATAWALPDSPTPPTPRQASGTARGRSHTANATATRSKGGTGRAPGRGKGQLPAYAPAARKFTVGQSAPARRGYDPASSVRVASKSTATSTYYTNADGSYTRSYSENPVNYRDASGGWQPIDTRLHAGPDGRWHEKANSLSATLAGAADDPQLASLVLNPGPGSGTGTESVTYWLQGAAHVTGSVSGSAVTYPGVLPGTDLRLTSTVTGLTGDLVLHSATAASSWVFPLDLHGLSASLSSDGSVVLRDASGRTAATIPASYAYDSSVDKRSGGPATTHAITYQVVTVAGVPQLRMSLDPAWLHDPARVFPVTVDPTLNTYALSTYVESNTPAADHSLEDFLKIGSYDSGTHAAVSYLQFPGSGIDNSKVTVSAAQLSLRVNYANGCPTAERFDVAPVSSGWTPSSLRSYPGPALGASIGNLTPSTPNACANTALDPTVGDDVVVPLSVATFNGWAAGTTADYGLAVYASTTDSVHWKYLASAANALGGPLLTLTYSGTLLPQIIGQSPPNGTVVTTLTPSLSAQGTMDPVTTPPNPAGGPQYDFQVYTSSGAKLVDSGLVNGAYQMPAGKLQWGQTYVWGVQAYDGTNYSLNPSWYQLTVAVPQPAITSTLAQNAGRGFDPAVGNYTTSATDAEVASAGPALSVVRDYNSRDPRVASAFGAAWSSVFDAQAAERYDASGAAVSVAVTYPDGSQVGFGRNADGTFTAPSGRAAKLVKLASGYELTDKADTTYTFAQALGPGVYGISSVSDSNARTVTFTWTSGHIATMSSAVSARALHLTWATPSGTSNAHVATVTTDPAIAGQSGTALTWTYNYAGDQLASVCPPGTTTACASYAYSTGSPYFTQVMDQSPQSYWPLAETSGTTAASAVLTNEGTDTATYNNVTLAATAAPLSGSTTMAPSFNGTSSDVALPDIGFGTSMAMSVSLWFKMPAGSPAGVLFSSSDMPIAPTATSGNYNPTLYVGTDGKLWGQFWFNTPTDTPNPIGTSVSVADGNWHHVVFTGSAATQSMYLDGGLVGSVNGWAAGGSEASMMPWLLKHSYLGTGFLGGLAWPDNPYTNDFATLHAMYFTGAMSNVSFYSTALTPVDVTNLYQAARRTSSLLITAKHPSGKAMAAVTYDPLSARVTHVTDENGGSWTLNPPTVTGSSQVFRSSVLGAGPVAYYRLGESAGASQAISEVKYGPGTYGSVTLGGASRFEDEPAAGFNGTSSSVALPTGLVGSGGNQSVGLWFKTTTGNGVLFSYENIPLTATTGLASYTPALYVGSDGKLQGEFWYSGGVAPIASSTSVADGRWHFVVLSAGTSAQSLYLDGTLVGSKSGTVAQTYAPGLAYVNIGAGFLGGPWPDQSHSSTVPATYFNGAIGDFAFYNSQLSGAQVEAQWAAAQNSSGMAPIETATVADPGGKTLTYRYDPLNGNRTVAEIDGLGNRTSYGYDTSGFLNTVTDANGDVTTTGHDADGNVVSRTTCQNQAAGACSTQYMTYKANTMGQDQAKSATVTASSSYAGAGWATGYLVDGNTTSVSGAWGWSSNTTTSSTATAWVQVDMGTARPLDQVDLYPRTDLMGMGFPQAFTVAVSADGSTWTTVTTQTNFAQPTAPNPAVFGFTLQNVRYVKVTGTTLRKDNNNNYVMQFAELTAVNDLPDPTAGELLTSRDGRSASATDNTYLTSYGYDAVGNPTSETTPPVAGFPSGRTTTVAYTDGTTVAAADTGFAPAGLPYKTTSPGGAVTTIAYFHDGDVASTTDADGQVTRYTYDNLGRAASKTVVSDTFPNGLVTSYQYDGQNQIVQETDPAVTDRVTGAVHTPQTTTVIDPDGNVTSQTASDLTGGDASRQDVMTYNSDGQLDSSTDAAGNKTSLTYDAYGNRATEADPNGTKTTYTYDPNGRLLTQVLSGYTGDPVNPQPASDLTEESRAYDPAGRLASVTDSMGRTTSYTYFDDNRVATVTRTASGQSPFVLKSDSYDGAGNPVREVTNNGATVTTNVVDAASRTTQTTVDPSGVNRTTTVAYTPDDGVATNTVTDSTGATQLTTATYDPMGRMLSRSIRSDGTGHPLAWWRLDQSSGATVLDSSGTGNTATASGVAWGNSSASFAGASGQQIVTNGPVLNTTASFSVSTWASVTGGSAWQTVAGQDGTNDMGLNLQWDSTNKKWAFSHDNNDGTSPAATRIEAPTASPLNTWTHVVGVYDANAGTLSLYVNGVSQGSVALTTPWSAGGPFTIGVGRYNGGPGGVFTGSVSNVQVYQRALSATDVSTLYTAGRTGATVASSPQLTTTWTRDKRGLPTSMTDPNGNTTSYAYDEAGHLAATTAPAVSTEVNGGGAVQVRPVNTTGYNTFGEPAEAQDPNGNVTTSVYDADGRAVSQTLPNYTPPGSSTPITATTVTSYDAVGNVTQVSDPLSKVTSYKYDQLGDVAQVTDANGGVTHDTYDTNGEQLSQTDPTGAQTQATYDALGRSLTSTTVERYPSTTTLTTTNSYAASSSNPGGAWLASTTTPAGAVTAYGYDNTGETTSVTDPAGNATGYRYDLLGRRTAAVAPDSTSTTVVYDQAGNPVKTSNLDATGAVVTSRGATYDGNGNMLSATDARGNTTTFTYDATNLLSQEVQPVTATSGITTSFGYDPAGNRTRFTDGRGNPWIYTYNSWNRPESVIEPATSTYTAAADRTLTTVYDADGRPVTQTQPGGVSIAATYDAVGNMLTQSGTGAEAATATRTFGYDAVGRITTAQTSAVGSTPASSETFGYNDRGELLTASGSAGASSFGYTADGLMATRTDDAGTTSYTYDTAGRLKTLADATSGSTLTYAYNTLSQVSAIQYGTSDTRVFGYDSLHRLATDALKTAAGATVGSITYGYDANSNLTAKTTIGFGTNNPTVANTYTYDEANRLTSWNNGTSTVAYGYDASGNRTQVGANVYTYDARDQLTSDGVNSYTYTARGTLASRSAGGTTTTTASDAFGQVAADAAQTYTYDALGRLLQTGGGSAHTLTYSGTGDTVASDSTATYSYDPGGTLTGVASGGAGRLVWTDQHTDVVAMFTEAGTGFAGSTVYDPLGNQVNGSGFMRGNLGYQSQWTDTTTGKVNMAARWYNPAVGQFQSRDTIAQNPVPNSAAANPFAYVDDNPLTGTDPTGHGWWSSLTSSVSSAWNDVTSTVSSGWNDVSSWASSTWDDTWNTVSSWGSDAWNWTVNTYHAAVHYVKDKYHRVTHYVHRAWNYVKRQAKRAIHNVNTAYHIAKKAVTKGVKAAGNFIKHHAAAIASFVVSTVVFMGCEAVVTAGSAGTLSVPGAVACGALAGAAGGLVDQGFKCASGARGACSAGAFLKAGVVGGVVGGLSGLGGALGGKALKFVGGKALSAIGGLLGRGGGEAVEAGADSLLTDTATSSADSIAESSADTAADSTATSATEDAAGSARPAARGARDEAAGEPSGGGDRPQAGRERASSTQCHSFTATTPVLMADGSTRAIDQVKAGDHIQNAVPGADATQTHTVANVIVTTTDHDFVDVTVAAAGTSAGAKPTVAKPSRFTKALVALAAGVATATAAGTAAASHDVANDVGVHGATLTTTFHHPFYDETRNAFVEAQYLRTGDRLQTPTGNAVVLAIRLYHDSQTTYDLTIGGLHTYYVIAGDTPVLVHNCGGDVYEHGGSTRYGALDSQGRPTSVSSSITKDTLDTGSDPLKSIKPPGWRGNGTIYNEARGHLLANRLGGSGRLSNNLVTITQDPVNSPIMRDFEGQIYDAVAGGQTVQYTATAIYGDGLAPIGIQMEAFGSDGFCLEVCLVNPAGR